MASIKKLTVSAALLAFVAFVAPRANAQTMGEYATTTAGISTGAGSMSSSTAMAPSLGSDNTGGGSHTWGSSSYGASWSDRVGAGAGLSGGTDFASRAATAGSVRDNTESRFPGTGFSTQDASESRFGSSERWKSSSAERFGSGELSARLGGGERWSQSRFSGGTGLDNRFNSISGN